MKTTIDIPEPLYREARIRAVQDGSTLKDLILKAIQHELQIYASPLPAKPSAVPKMPFQSDEQGWPVLTRASEDKIVVTEELINRLREEEGI